MISVSERQDRRDLPAGFHLALSLAISPLVSGWEYTLKRYAEVEREVWLYVFVRLIASATRRNHACRHRYEGRGLLVVAIALAEHACIRLIGSGVTVTGIHLVRVRRYLIARQGDGLSTRGLAEIVGR